MIQKLRILLSKVFPTALKKVAAEKRAQNLEADVVAFRDMIRQRRKEVNDAERALRSKEAELKHQARMSRKFDGDDGPSAA